MHWKKWMRLIALHRIFSIFSKPYLSACMEDVMPRIHSNLSSSSGLPFLWLTWNVVIKTSSIMKIIWLLMNITQNYCNTIGNIYHFTCRITLVSYIFIWLKCLNFIYGNISIIVHKFPETQDYLCLFSTCTLCVWA